MKTAEILMYIGIKGSGKTWKALKDSRKYKRRLRININARDDTLREGAQIVTSPSELLRTVAAAGSGAFCICYELPKEKYSPVDSLITAAKVAVRFGNMHFLCDESHRSLPRDLSKFPEVDEIITQGRHIGVPSSWTSVTPKMLSPVLRAECDKIAIFHANDPTYLKYLHETARHLIEPLSKAPKHSYVEISLTKPPKLIKAR